MIYFLFRYLIFSLSCWYNTVIILTQSSVTLRLTKYQPEKTGRLGLNVKNHNKFDNTVTIPSSQATLSQVL
jgi:hypothetical protein